MLFALCTEGDLPGWLQAVVRELCQRGHEVAVVSDMTWVLEGAEQPDAAWVRWVPGSYGADPPVYWQAAMALEALGVPMLNPLLATSVASDKLLSAAVFAQHDLPHPRVWELAAASWDTPRVVKPILGSRGIGVMLAAHLDEACAHERTLGRRCLAQEHVRASRCLRAVASPARVLKTYEKQVEPGTLVASVSQGADRVEVEASAEIVRLACSAVDVLGGGLMGVDLLEDAEGRLWLLEANSSFAFDEADALIVEGYADELVRLARG